MDESESVCPLCCEELDLSDQQFYPCKCGYQVCMWCWHRIRESESGLCPACRTPYGDDPHEFSAVDVEEVLKANKEKAAAEKRERHRQQTVGAGSESSMGGGPDVESAMTGTTGAGALLSRGGPMDLPKDRTQLANMRVIRRNLVYAVGLPPSIANEDMLRKPEYFGQYGKISKIVLNRSNTVNGDPRRASASAYVTFVHKEDTLACILALDGFFIDGRNIRASYGTSKYCSAFIKNVRCNNPECTYLHCMGEAEDTFTKQEIQAGYVTSGRDVLARQQQIVAQALSAASGAAGGGTRRKIGGGGPSGTGKSSSNPAFPPPCFDEPQKPPAQSLIHAPGPISRSVSAIAAPLASSNGSSVGPPNKVMRSVSLSETGPQISSDFITAPGKPMSTQTRKTVTVASGTSAATNLSVIGNSAVMGTTAASVVAGVHSLNIPSAAALDPPAPHTTLTPLTPLKRMTQSKGKGGGGSSFVIGASSSVDSGADSIQMPPNMPVPNGLTPAEKAVFLEQRRDAMAAMAKQQREMAIKLTALRYEAQKKNALESFNVAAVGTAPTSPSSSVSSSSGPSNKLSLNHSNELGVGCIGGTVIGGSVIGGGAIRASAGISGVVGTSLGGENGSIGGSMIGGIENTARSSSLGGEIFTGQLPASSSNAVGSHKDKWGAVPIGGSLFGSGSAFGMGSGGIWGGETTGSRDAAIGGSGYSGGTAPGVIGGGNRGFGSFTTHGSIGGTALGGDPFAPGSGPYNAGSSALASMLGINLPTGSGSLRDPTSMWPPSASSQPPIGSLNVHGGAGVIGSGPKVIPPIGGVAIGGGMATSGGGFHSGSAQQNPIGSGSNSDIALLQSLLPGVHITSGNAQQPAAPATSGGAGGGGGWRSLSGPSASQQTMGVVGMPVGPSHQGGVNNTWSGGGGYQATGNPGGVIGQRGHPQNQKQSQGNIW